jgi:hypothetical protein
LSDSGLSSVLRIFTPDANNKEDEQVPVKRRSRSEGGAGSRELEPEFISRTHAGYFRSWLPNRLGGAEACRITGGAGINFTVCSLKQRIKIPKKRIVI